MECSDAAGISSELAKTRTLSTVLPRLRNRECACVHYIAYQSNEIGRRTKHPELIPLPTDSLGGFGMMVHCARCGLGVAISVPPKLVAYENRERTLVHIWQSLSTNE